MVDGKDLVVYNPDYHVLICRECKYAVQKSALDSHLRRHKVYRGHRQRLLSAWIKLDLPEPEEVQMPAPESAPIDGLPVMRGLKCSFPECGRLCVSTKRMRRHWSEAHGVKEPPESCSSTVCIQTFFRGTKVKYFQVTPSGGAAYDIENETEDQGAAYEPAVSEPLEPVDLDVLRCFNHFTTRTMHAFYDMNGDHVEYWRTIVLVALKRRWLMSGILALALTHMASATQDDEENRILRVQRDKHWTEFCAGYDDKQSKRGEATHLDEGDEAAARMICMQRCLHWTTGWTVTGTSPPDFTPCEFMDTIQGCFDGKAAVRLITLGDTLPRAAVAPSVDEILATPIHAPIEIREAHYSMPQRMAKILDKPDRSSDYFATLTVIPDLTRCFNIAYQSRSAQDAWNGMVAWLLNMPFHFHEMIAMDKPVALVVLAQWAMLVERVERHSWFVQGSSTMLLRYIRQRLPEHVYNSDLIPRVSYW